MPWKNEAYHNATREIEKANEKKTAKERQNKKTSTVSPVHVGMNESKIVWQDARANTHFAIFALCKYGAVYFFPLLLLFVIIKTQIEI